MLGDGGGNRSIYATHTKKIKSRLGQYHAPLDRQDVMILCLALL
jgi:hypothetical protein